MSWRKITKVGAAFVLTVGIAIAVAAVHGTIGAEADGNSTFSGVLTDQNSNPIAGAFVELANGSNGGGNTTVLTDSAGHFSLTVTPGLYNLWVGGDSVVGNMTLGGNYTTDTVDLSNGDINQNLQLNVAAIHVTVEDANGIPLSGVTVRSKGDGYTAYFPGYNTEIQENSIGTTDANGEISLTTLVGQTYLVSQSVTTYICAYTAPVTCISSPLTINGDVTITLVQSLAAPANLTVPSPTHNPSLSWSAVGGASSYNVYRNDGQSNAKIGSTSSTTFNDTGVVDGNYNYYVTAVNSVQESTPSNFVAVTVDNTNPSITYSLSSTPTIYGWNNTNVTVTFNCNDTGSGIASCSSPVIFNSEGANQLATGIATDNLGNTSTVSAIVSIDKTSPVASNLNLSTSKRTGILTVSASSSDALSGIGKAEFYIDTDPGMGSGVAMTYANGQVTGQASTSGLSKGKHTVYVRIQDKAGNWSSTISGIINV